MTEPKTDSEWTIRALNIHGAFFERWCRELIRKTQRWELKYANYPVGVEGVVEGELDLRADLRTDGHLVSLLIECKKHNPEFVDWIFLPKRDVYTGTPLFIWQLRRQRVRPGETPWDVVVKTGGLPWKSPIADDARETRGSYLQYRGNNKTKTANHSITEAARQVAVAARWISFEEERHGKVLGAMLPAPDPRYWFHHIIPVIVTTARLRLCEFDPADIDPATGVLPLEKANLTEVPDLRFEYPLPLSIQATPNPSELAQILVDGLIERFQRLQIVVINSLALESFLNGFTLDPNHPFFSS